MWTWTNQSVTLPPGLVRSYQLTIVQVPDHLPDKVGDEPSSEALVGYTFEYYYPSKIGYRISFAKDRVYFSMPEPVHGLNYFSWPYRLRELRPKQYLAHWMGPGRKSHISLILDLENKTVDASALMPGRFELWDRATFENYKTNGEGALYNRPPTEEPEPW